jgi:hypothetical protein
MKPFNLEAALNGAKVVTRDGKPVKMGCYNKEAKGGHNIAGWLFGTLLCWYHDGSYSTDFTTPHPYDLFMAPTERKEWVVRVVNPVDHNDSHIAGPFLSYHHAKDVYNARREGWATIHEITIIE